MPIPGLSKKTYSPQAWKKHAQTNGFPVRRFNNGKIPNWTVRKFFTLIKKITKLVLFFSVLGTVCFGVALITYSAWISKDLPSPDKIINRAVPLSTKIYDRTGETVLFNIHGDEKRTLIQLDKIPDTVKWATLTAEDRQFYQHKGISIRGIIRSVFLNFTTGSKVGGSTLTQQFIKNAILTPDKTYTRKIKEILLSYKVERKFTKDEILQLYFNEIPYGSTAYGIESASQTYFGKSVQEVNLAEAAILAAIPNRPSYYINHPDQLIVRQHWILDGMVEQGYVTAEETTEAKKQNIELKKINDNILAPHFVMFVKEYLSEKYGEKTVEQGGLSVITTLDLEKQKMAEEILVEQAEKNVALGATNAALVAIDPKNGQILSMIGSKDFFDEEIDGQVNVVTRTRQPGSSFKPIVYTAAFKKGFSPETVLYDVETTFKNYDGKPYEPKNYTLTENGPVTMRKALAGSLNIPAVKTIYLAGINNVLDLAEDLGYTTLKQRNRFGLSLVLGGGEVKLIEHTTAFATFAREGERPTVSGILRIEDKDGNVLEEFQEQLTKVLDTNISRLITDVLSDNESRIYIFGSPNSLTLPGRPVAVKTGTTNDFRDAWAVGFTPSLAVGVWVGNNDFSEMKKGADGSKVAAPIWQKFMTRALEGTPVEEFKKPRIEPSQNPASNGTYGSGITVEVDKISGKLATENTPKEFIEKRTYQMAHDILHYVDKENPNGPIPENPALDQQYIAWEEGVKKWAEKNNVTLEEPPTEKDDVHTPENTPTLVILSPLSGQTITSRNISAQVHTAARLGMEKVEYFINGKLISTSYLNPYSLETTLNDPSIENGNVTLKAVAYDTALNKTEKFINVFLSLPDPPSKVSWLAPRKNSIITKDNFPVEISFALTGKENIESIDIYYEDGTNPPVFISTYRGFSEDTVSTIWNEYPGFGVIGLFAEVKNRDGSQYETGQIIIEIK